MPVCLAEALTLSVLERGSQSVNACVGELHVSGRQMLANKMYWSIKKYSFFNIVYVHINFCLKTCQFK